MTGSMGHAQGGGVFSCLRLAINFGDFKSPSQYVTSQAGRYCLPGKDKDHAYSKVTSPPDTFLP